jgi:hypothetical protein
MLKPIIDIPLASLRCPPELAKGWILLARISLLGVGAAYNGRPYQRRWGVWGERTHTPLVWGWKRVGRVVGRALEILLPSTGGHFAVGVEAIHGLHEVHLAVDDHDAGGGLGGF